MPTQEPELIARTRKRIEALRLLKRGERALVAVSGGLDSMVLLQVLHTLSKEFGWKLAVAHLNHCLRGKSSDADERLVERTARKLKLPFYVDRKRIAELAKAEKISLEMAARQARHEFLARTARRLKFKTIALAHHGNDQVELFLLRLFRGSGGDGLSGMRWSSQSPADRGVRLVRPFLRFPRSDLEFYARGERIAFREDKSNTDTTILRNKLRHELIPLLHKQYHPALEGAILRSMELLGSDAEFAAEAARAWINSLKTRTKGPTAKGRTVGFNELHVAVQRRVIQQQLIALNIEPQFGMIEMLRLRPEEPWPTEGRTRESLRTIWRDQSGLVKAERGLKLYRKEAKRAVALGKGQGARFGGLTFQWSFTHSRMMAFKKVEGREFFDADRIGPSIILRRWQPGDRFQPIGMPRPIKLQDLFVNAKIARERRHKLVIATTASGEIFWVENLRMSEPFKIQPSTKKVLDWRWRPVASQSS